MSKISLQKTKFNRQVFCKGCAGVFYYQGPADAGKFCSDECRRDGGFIECQRCGKFVRSYITTATFCKDCEPYSYETFGPIKRKAWSIGANILGGKGKTEWMAGLISDAIDKPCPYCGKKLTLDNISLDHKEPFGSTDARRKKAENVELRTYTDRKENLHLVCKECNTLKSDFNDKEFREFLAFTKSWTGSRKLLRRLAQSLRQYGKHS